MIEYIKGELTELTPALATVEAGGVGYGLSISLNTFSAIQGKKEVKLYVYESIREDAHVLFGFVNKKEREMFLQLITVNGVGANTARMMLSGIVDLKDKIVALGIADQTVPGPAYSGGEAAAVVKEEAVSALTMLGFSPAPTQKVVMQILKEQPDLPVEQVVKLALKQIK